MNAVTHLALDSNEWCGSCPDLYVDFPVARLADAQVLWINERYFLDKGWDVTDEAVSQNLKTDLRSLAYTVVDSKNASASHERIYADRYGGSKIGSHGGSGRCGIVRDLQLKGVGITPLVGEEYQVAGVMGRPQRDRPPFHRFHSDGAVTLEEAIRETIYAEVACAEMPHGAVPIVAILRTGTRMPWGEECAILVRPNFFRAAYLERATRFRPAMHSRQHHAVDSKRVREMVAILEDDDIRKRRFGVNVDTLAEYARRVARQMAFAHIQRLSFGPYLSNNLSINGEVMDFGAARAVESWRRAIVVDMACAYGQDELIEFLDSCTNMLFYIKKYSRSNNPFAILPSRLNHLLASAYEHALDEFLPALFGLNGGHATPEIARIGGLLKKYFFSQQKSVVNYLSDTAPQRGSWLHDVLANKEQSGSLEKRILDEIISALGSLYAGNTKADMIEAKLSAAKRTLRTRDLLLRDALQRRIYDELLMDDCAFRNSAQIGGEIEEFIRATVSRSRRMFDDPGESAVILGSASNSYSTALYCEVIDPKTGARSKALKLRARVNGQGALFFGQRIALSGTQAKVHGTHVEYLRSLPADYSGERIDIEIAGASVTVPRMDILY